MFKSSIELNSSLKKPSVSNSSIKKKLTFNLVQQLDYDNDDKAKQRPRIIIKNSDKYNYPSGHSNEEGDDGKFEKKLIQMQEKYSPMVEYNSGIYLDYYTCNEYNKKVKILFLLYSRLKILNK